jgi:hypothetical protein
MADPQLAPAPSAIESGSSLAQLSPAPPSKRAKGPTIWDRDHISETLANIGAGFFSSQNFGDGLGAAVQTIAKGTRQLRDDQKKSVTYGGPDNRFEIVTDGQGNRSVSEVSQFSAAIAAKSASAAREKAAPSVKEAADLRARGVNGVLQLPPTERADEYANLLSQLTAAGIPTAGMPPVWSDNYGTVGGMMGMTVGQALTNERGDKVADERGRHNGVTEAQRNAALKQGDARVGIAQATNARAAAKAASGPRSAPPSTRGNYKKPTTRAEFNRLPSGAKIIAPDGSIRIKP